MTTTNKIIIGGFFLSIAAVGAVIYFSGTLFQEAAPSHQWIKGNPDAKAQLVEYVDFQCPACKVYHPIMKQLQEEFASTLRIEIRHFPLTSIHRNAFAAAKAAEAAGRQKKFFEMQDLLFEKQENWSDLRGAEDMFTLYAEELLLDKERFHQDLNDKSIEVKIRQDQSEGNRLGVDGTPAFFLNGKRIQNPRSYEAFKSLIEGVLTK